MHLRVNLVAHWMSCYDYFVTLLCKPNFNIFNFKMSCFGDKDRLIDSREKKRYYFPNISKFLYRIPRLILDADILVSESITEC